MLRRSRAVVLIASLLLVGAPAAAAAAPAAASLPTTSTTPAVSTVPTVVAGMTLTAPTHSLVRAQLEKLTVQLHLVDPDGVFPRGGSAVDKGWNCPCVVLQSFTSAGAPFRVGPQASGARIVSLALVSGTPQDGVWRGTTIVGATDAGIWRPTGLDAGDFVDLTERAYPDSFVPAPAELTAAVSFNLRGYDWPVLSIRIPTTVTPFGVPFVVRGSASTSRTHLPLPGIRVLAATQVCTPFDHLPGTPSRTTSTGAWAVVSTDSYPVWCAWWAPDSNGFPVNIVSATRVHVSAVVTARVSASSVPAGRAVVVTGVVKPASSGSGPVGLVLQRYYSGSWHRVAAAQATWNGAYRFVTTPPRGTWSYRVRVPSTTEVFGTTSPRFTVRAY